jgi:putative membrane protein
MADPRVFFAAERTLLAWIRSGLTVVALGFVVARFGLFLNLVARQPFAPPVPTGSPTLSNLIGILLVLGGTATMYAAGVQHRAFLSALPPDELPARYRPRAALFFAFSLASLGLLIAVYLAWSAA